MKIIKWILGLLAGLGGVAALFASGKNKQKIKEKKKDEAQERKERDELMYYSS